MGLPHRLDRPTSGAVLFCKTEKSLIRFNNMFKNSEVKKVYLAICDGCLDSNEGTLVHFIKRDSIKNKSFAYLEDKPNTKKAVLNYKLLSVSDRYYLYQIELLTGRHHQIRAQLAASSIHIKGDIKYGAKRSNIDGGISLHSFILSFIHPVSKKEIFIKAQPPANFNIFSFDF